MLYSLEKQTIQITQKSKGFTKIDNHLQTTQETAQRTVLLNLTNLIKDVKTLLYIEN